MAEFICTLRDLRKVVGTDRIILDGITLAFIPGAKIGVVGPNGTGKSSLLRILSGEDKDFLGEARAAEGTTIGFLSQEPRLDPSKDVLGNVEEGLAGIRDLLRRFDAFKAEHPTLTATAVARLFLQDIDAAAWLSGTDDERQRKVAALLRRFQKKRKKRHDAN